MIVSQLFDSQNLSIIGSVDEESFPCIRAMLKPRKRKGIHTIYFSTNTSTQKVKRFHTNRKACLYVYDPQRFDSMPLKGTMEVLTGPQYKEMLRQERDEVYYKEGV